MISATKKENLTAEISARTHHLLSGVSEKLGGHDEGLNPHEIFEASLAACTIITVQMYAARKGIQLQGINVDVKILTEGEESTLERTISLVGDLTAEEKSKLTEIANKCPIHKLMESHIKILTTVTV